MIGVVLADFKKAFDLVHHQIFLDKLSVYGIKEEALMWFNPYLTHTHRKQQVSVNNCCTARVYSRTTSVSAFYK